MLLHSCTILAAAAMGNSNSRVALHGTRGCWALAWMLVFDEVYHGALPNNKEGQVHLAPKCHTYSMFVDSLQYITCTSVLMEYQLPGCQMVIISQLHILAVCAVCAVATDIVQAAMRPQRPIAAGSRTPCARNTKACGSSGSRTVARLCSCRHLTLQMP